MKVCDYIIDYLVKRGVRHVFGIIGGACAFMVDAIGRRKDIEFVCFQHEQAAAMAADAYARVTKNIGVTMVTSGPGATNLLTGTCCAWFDSVPVLNISGQVNTWESTTAPGCSNVRQVGFQETNIIPMIKSITKYAAFVKDPESVEINLDLAFYHACFGRPGPVWLDIPMNVQKAEMDSKISFSFDPSMSVTVHDHDKDWKLDVLGKIGQLTELINQAKRPVIIIGGGIKNSDTIDQARRFVSQLSCPVVTTWSGFGIMPHNYPLYIGPYGVYGHRAANFAVQNSDLLIALGSRLDTRQTGGNLKGFAPKAKKVMIDIDPAELGKKRGVEIDLAIETDLRIFFQKWFEFQPDFRWAGNLNWIKLIEGWKKKYPICLPEYYDQPQAVNPYVFIETLSQVVADGATVVTDCGGNLIWTMQAWEPKLNHNVFSAMGNSPMGYSMAGAIGASIGLGKKSVICIIGDGGMQVNIQELQTIKHYQIPLKIFILNSKSYAIVRNFQDEVFEGRHFGVDSANGYSCPDFQQVARAYGITALSINNHWRLAENISQILRITGPVVCDVQVLENQPLIPKAQFGNPLENMAPFLPPEEIAANMKEEEWPKGACE